MLKLTPLLESQKTTSVNLWYHGTKKNAALAIMRDGFSTEFTNDDENWNGKAISFSQPKLRGFPAYISVDLKPLNLFRYVTGADHTVVGAREQFLTLVKNNPAALKVYRRLLMRIHLNLPSFIDIEDPQHMPSSDALAQFDKKIDPLPFYEDLLFGNGEKIFPILGFDGIVIEREDAMWAHIYDMNALNHCPRTLV